MTELTSLTISEAGRRLAAGEVSSAELTEAYLARIERLNPAINAYVLVTGERARADAALADEELARGERRGPLHGVPIGLKDLVDTAGIRTAGGAKIFMERVPTEDAAVAERLRAAGTVLLGKLNTHELAFGTTTNNPHFGPTRNPWDQRMIPGGSSGGSGAAIAAGLAVGTIGTDTGGSIRIPASLCGCVGLKPTYGRVSKRGILPMSWLVDHPGPIVGCVEDAAIMLQALAGYDPGDFATVPMPVPDYSAGLRSGVKGMRVGVAPAFLELAGAEVRAAVETAARWFGQEGADVSEVELPLDRDRFSAAFAVVMAESREAVWDEFQARPDDFGADLQRVYSAPLPDGVGMAKALREQKELCELYRVAMDPFDVVLTPTTPLPAVPIGQTTLTMWDSEVYVDNVMAGLTGMYNLARVPAMSVPCGFSAEGLPLGMTIAAKPWAEEAVLRAGWAYEQAHEWVRKRAL